MTAAADTLVAVCQVGGRLEPAGEHLRTLLPRECPDGLRNHIRQNKPQLLRLLQQEFLIVHSGALNQTVFFAADDHARAALVAAGAERGCIYTCDELRELVELNRHEPITADELLRIHTAKRLFNGRIADGQVDQ